MRRRLRLAGCLQYLEDNGILYTIRIPANDVLYEDIDQEADKQLKKDDIPVTSSARIHERTCNPALMPCRHSRTGFSRANRSSKPLNSYSLGQGGADVARSMFAEAWTALEDLYGAVGT
jgi:hypothetical protein